VSTAGVEANLPIRLRLELFRIHDQTPRATDETELPTDPQGPPTPPGSTERGTFSLIAAAEMPPVRWHGINLEPFTPPPHRAVLSAMQPGDGGGELTNVKIAALRLEELPAALRHNPGLIAYLLDRATGSGEPRP
jgi:hypothetical protein